MPEIDDVVSGEPIESSWGNLIRSRTMQRYTSETERDFLNPTPQEGDLAYIQNINDAQIFDGEDWVTFELGDNLRRRNKSIGQSVADSTATQVDNDLHFTADAGDRWSLELWLAVSGNDSIGIRTRWQAPAGSSASIGVAPTPVNDQSGVVRSVGITSLGLFAVALDANGIAIVINGIVQVGPTPGEVQFEWGADSSSEGNLTVEQGSYLIATRLE